MRKSANKIDVLCPKNVNRKKKIKKLFGYVQFLYTCVSCIMYIIYKSPVISLYIGTLYIIYTSKIEPSVHNPKSKGEVSKQASKSNPIL